MCSCVSPLWNNFHVIIWVPLNFKRKMAWGLFSFCGPSSTSLPSSSTVDFTYLTTSCGEGWKETFPKPLLEPRHSRGWRNWKAENSPRAYLPCSLHLQPPPPPSFLIFSWQVNNGNPIFLKQSPSTEIINIRFNKMLDFKFPVASAAVSYRLPKGEGERIDK